MADDADTTTVVALLRSVNIGGRRLAMAELRAGLADAGCGRVATYVQSGNVVLTLPPEATGSAGPGQAGGGDGGAGWLAETIGRIAGFRVELVLRTRSELEAVVAANPYPEAGGSRLHVLFYAEPQPADLFSPLDLASFAPEHATVAGREVYLHLPGGMGRSQLAAAVDKVNRAKPPRLVTARNWNTVLELVRLSA